MTKQLDGREAQAYYIEQLKQKTEELKSRMIYPTVIILNASEKKEADFFSKQVIKTGKKMNIDVSMDYIHDLTQEEVLKKIEALNDDPRIHGILLPKPLPQHLNASQLNERIDPRKDIDGTNPYNLGKLLQRQESFIPATVRGVMLLCEYYQIDFQGKNTLIIGQSEIVGRPMAIVALNKRATISIAHTATKNLSELTSQADLIISAAGAPNLITESMIQPQAILIDVGTTFLSDGKLHGDISKKAKAIAQQASPVPGGVGPLTTLALFEQLINYLHHQ
ncbi:bifunctional 5,10-methylenetetrahydrofolate dehydrogenase/5,10-methenyltetrahydrofolate cyclohydrolase [Atopobacter phocae]|uniref:bifunctional 5,10-methylenetetrahydrofolate dehydrogenase/5,10-methenyltetrahydrofolate cyclohydrolase n=1 Tax=Atopobacter phocae TaxID=136492 RepID=UPI0004706D54|nr:tetrahydrofolate dehydrogenase/cyclohydrolase catalytic domain-containing protein [Atopobacter phocae]